MAGADQEDGAPSRGELEAEGGNENDGENIQTAQRERDLAESNVRDLMYQKVALSEQLKTISKQLERTSDKLSNASEQLGCTFEQLRSISDQKKGILGR